MAREEEPTKPSSKSLRKGSKVEKINELNNDLDVLSKRMTRRHALTMGAKAAIGIAGVAVVGAGAYAAYTAANPPKAQTITETATSTSTATSTTTAVSTTLITTTPSISGGPGIDYYYDPKLSGTTINYLVTNKPENTVQLSFIPLFQQETGITVNYVVLDEATLETKAQAMFAAQGSDYDVVDSGNLGSVAYAWWKQGWTTPLSNFIPNTPKGYNANDILPAVTTSCVTFAADGGQLTSLPNVFAPQGMGYRIDLLQNAGMTFPLAGQVELGKYDSVPAGNQPTLEEMLAAVDKADNPPQTYGFLLPDTVPFVTTFWQFFVVAQNKSYFTKDFHSNFLDPDVVAATTQWANVMNKYVPNPANLDFGTFFGYGTAGRAVAIWSPNALPSIYYASGSKVNPQNFKLAWFPKEKVNSTWIAGATMSVNKFSKQQDAAWSFISFCTSPRTQGLFLQNGLGAIRTSVMQSPLVASSQDWTVQIPRGGLLWMNEAKPVGSTGMNLAYIPVAPKIPQATTWVNKIGTYLAALETGKQVSSSDVMNALTQCDTFTNQFLQQIGFQGKQTWDFGT